MKKLFVKVVLLAMASITTISCSTSKPDDKPSGSAPVIGTTEVQNLLSASALVKVTFSNSGTGTILEAGVELNSVRIKSTDVSTTGYSVSLPNLNPNTNYSIRAYAVNSTGTAYGSSTSFKTIVPAGTVTDIDGNVYPTVIIGTQEWTTVDLKVLHYADGTPIPNVTDNLTWSGLSSGAYRYYSDNSANKSVLYNHFAVTSSKKLAPNGWHVATFVDWGILQLFLGDANAAGAAMKEAGTSHWLTPNLGATNSSGFCGVSTGHCSVSGVFSGMGQEAWYWASDRATYSYLSNTNPSFMSGYPSQECNGLAVRIVR